MSNNYSSSQLPAGLQAATSPLGDSDLLVVQQAGDTIVRGVTAANFKAYAGGGGSGGGCDESMLVVAAVWDPDTAGYTATIDWALSCTFNVQIDTTQTSHPGSGNYLLLTHANLPAAATLAERVIVVSYVGGVGSFYVQSVADAHNQPGLSIGYTGGSGLFGVGVIKCLMPGTLTTPPQAEPPVAPTVVYTFAESY